MIEIEQSGYFYSDAQTATLSAIAEKVEEMRKSGALDPQTMRQIRDYFKIKNIYHSNAIEGNRLTIGETRLVVSEGMTISGKSLKDVAEAKNLNHAVDYLEELITDSSASISEREIRDIHSLILLNIDDENAGKYRGQPVKISGSEFTPPGPESVPGDMSAFGGWLSGIDLSLSQVGRPDAIPIAAAAHTRLVSIHPFIDGNGRTSRLLLNLVLMRLGYPIAIITTDDKLRYYDALEHSHAKGDLSPFVSLISETVSESLEEYQRAISENRNRTGWASDVAARFGKQQEKKLRAEYEIWRNAMGLMKSYFRDAAESINENAPYAQLYFKDFGEIEFEKYEQLRSGHSAKRTWFFRVDAISGDRTARILFFFGFASHQFRVKDATLHVAIESPPGSFNYERMSETEDGENFALLEFAYNAETEAFDVLTRSGEIHSMRFEDVTRLFYESVASTYF